MLFPSAPPLKKVKLKINKRPFLRHSIQMNLANKGDLTNENNHDIALEANIILLLLKHLNSF